MAGIVVYGSQYGTARQYAEELARRTGIEARQYDSVGEINQYDTIAYVGALYAGGVLGMKKTFSGPRHFIASLTALKCPLCGGLKVPPKTPILICFFPPWAVR